MLRRDARIIVGPDSAILEASEGALDLLGMTFDQLKALPPGALSLEEDRAATEGFETAWREAGADPIVGSGRVRLLDGRMLRLRFVLTPQPDGSIELIMERSDELVAHPPRMFTVGRALSAWRAAERRLAAVVPGTEDWIEAQREIEHFRHEYHRLAQRQPEPSPD